MLYNFLPATYMKIQKIGNLLRRTSGEEGLNPFCFVVVVFLLLFSSHPPPPPLQPIIHVEVEVFSLVKKGVGLSQRGEANS
jgi:hypothetical protein